jgi:hypothetical protein
VKLVVGSQVAVVTFDSAGKGTHQQLCAASQHACGWYLTPAGQGRAQLDGLFLQHGVHVDGQGCLVLVMDLQLPAGRTRAEFDTFLQQRTSRWGAAVHPHQHGGRLELVDLVNIPEKVGPGWELMM